jgi:hypothetical protein
MLIGSINIAAEEVLGWMANPSRSLGFLPEPWGWRVQRERPSLQQGQVWVFVLKDLPTEVFKPLRA